MSRLISQFYNEEYNSFKIRLVSDWAAKPDFIKENETTIKSIFYDYLSIACAATIVGSRTKRNEFLIELIEAIKLSMVLSVKGIENTTFTILRQIIELSMKYIYFSSHPVEYSWAKNRDDYREINFQFLINYLCRTEELRKFKNHKSILDTICDKYAVLSRYVHTQNSRFLSYKKGASICKPHDDLLIKYYKIAKPLWPTLTVLLILFSSEKYLKSNEIEKKIIRKSLPRNLKRDLDSHLSL